MNQLTGNIYSAVPRLSLILVIILVSVVARAQPGKLSGEVAPVGLGSATVSGGIGVGAPYDGSNGGFGFKFAAEYGLWQVGSGVITLGPEAGMAISSNYHYINNNEYRGHTIIVAGRGAYHYGWAVPGLDTYGGFAFGPGFHHFENKSTGFKDNNTIPVFGAFVGASYFINPQFGFNSELGFDITNFQVGIILKLQ